jgi:hypothetical protein
MQQILVTAGSIVTDGSQDPGDSTRFGLEVVWENGFDQQNLLCGKVQQRKTYKRI